jgi:hypothetical protein
MSGKVPLPLLSELFYFAVLILLTMHAVGAAQLRQ